MAIGSWVAPNASVIGQVALYDQVSVWYGAVVRGDKNKIKIGRVTNIQDRAVVSTVANLDSGFPADVDIGDFVTVGHGAMLTSCTIGNHVLIGQGAIIQEGSVVENNSIVAAGAVVLPDTLIPSGQLWAGNPAVYIRDVTEDEVENFEKQAKNYSVLAKEHSDEFLPFGTVYQEAEKLSK